MELTVNLGPDTYPIYIENGILPQTGSYIRKFFTGKKIMIISDDHVFPLYGKTVLDSLKDYECHSLGQAWLRPSINHCTYWSRFIISIFFSRC